ncbi:MAG TPA: hypothetical protein VIM37_02410 [Candidatus Microsaccharimonas sp.]
MRSILTFVLTVFITALLWVTFGSHTTTHAVDGSAASWKGANILYSGNQYFSAGDAKAGDGTGLAVGTHYYLYTAQTNGPAPKTQKAFVIYFAPGTDPPKETKATFITYDYSSQQVFSNPTDKGDIVVTPQGSESTYSSCTVEGIGWIICPVTVFLADSMDNLFNLLKGFFVVAPANTTNTTNDLYTAWNVMRSIANVAFIIVFLIIIYSQLTSIGISNYGLKKLLPRLIIAAVLVNVSYFVCAIAIDISNILGYSIQDIFTTIRQNTFQISNDTWANSTGMGWAAVAAYVLSGGTAVVAGAIAFGGSVGAALYMLVPILLGLVATVLVVLLILAARQAIIVILVIIAPLAFVAYLLPNTEQWFKKWRDLFMTMLVFFPAFSLIFGGSQLAGGIIIENAGKTGNVLGGIIGVIFGLAVQVAPLVITPMLLKLSGGLLGRIAGLVNDPKKGFMDRTKNWSKDRSEMLRLKSLANTSGRPNPFRGLAQNLDNRNRRVKERTALYGTENDNRYNETPWHEKVHTQEASAHLNKERIEKKLEAHTLKEVNVNGTKLNLQTLELEASKVQLEKMTERTNGLLSEYRAGGRDVTIDAATIPKNGERSRQTERLRFLQNQMSSQVIQIAAEKQRQVAAQYEQQKAISTELSNDNSGLLTIAQGIGGDGARIRARSSALATLNKLEAEALENNVKLITEVAFKQNKTLKQYSKEVVEKAMGGDTSIKESDLAAALQAQASEKNMTLFEQARGSEFINQEIVSKIIVTNAGTFKEAGGYHMQDDLSLNIQSLGGDKTLYAQKLAAKRVETLGNVAATGLDKLKFGWIAEFAQDGNLRQNIANADVADIRKAYNNLTTALNNPDVLATLGDREDQIRAIEAAMAARFNQPPTPDPRKY